MAMSGLRSWLEKFFARPTVPFVLEVLLFAPLVLAPAVPAALPYYLVAGPWLIGAVLLLNAPLVTLVTALVSGYREGADTLRNHALEHATIHFLERTGGDAAWGRAEKRGFRVFGRLTPSEIHHAFAEVAVRVRGGMAIPYISPYCGSNRITTLGLGVALLGVLTVLTVLLTPPLWVRTAALAASIVAFYRYRDRVGNWIQDRYFMATDFDEVAIRQIRKIRGSNRGGRLLYFVQTRVG